MTGPAGPAGPQGPAGPAGSGAAGEESWGFAGFTPASYTGSVPNGRTGMHALCAAAFPGAHLCHVSEFILSATATAPPAAGAWLDTSTEDGSQVTHFGAPKLGRYVGVNACNNWTDAVAGSYPGTWVTPASGITNGYQCNASRPLACCNGVPRTRFAGFTATTTTGNGGGRHAMHAACAASFPGAHLCHVAEYIRAASAAPVPATGAWVDTSTVNGSSVVHAGVPTAGRYVGVNACNNWTDAVAGSYPGTWITQPGGVTNGYQCNASRSLACCL